MGTMDGKVVVVTGAASGMGQSGAELFAREGARHVYVVDVDEAGGADTVERVRRAGAGATFVAVDVSDESQVAALIDRVVAEQGALDAAWSNAGITDESRPFTELDMAAWDRMIRINLTAAFVCMKHELRHMAARGGGAIVNTSSGAGLMAAPG